MYYRAVWVLSVCVFLGGELGFFCLWGYFFLCLSSPKEM